jgi:hypothetical protein
MHELAPARSPICGAVHLASWQTTKRTTGPRRGNLKCTSRLWTVPTPLRSLPAPAPPRILACSPCTNSSTTRTWRACASWDSPGSCQEANNWAFTRLQQPAAALVQHQSNRRHVALHPQTCRPRRRAERAGARPDGAAAPQLLAACLTGKTRAQRGRPPPPAPQSRAAFDKLNGPLRTARSDSTTGFAPSLPTPRAVLCCQQTPPLRPPCSRRRPPRSSRRLRLPAPNCYSTATSAPRQTSNTSLDARFYLMIGGSWPSFDAELLHTHNAPLLLLPHGSFPGPSVSCSFLSRFLSSTPQRCSHTLPVIGVKTLCPEPFHGGRDEAIAHAGDQWS